MGCVYGFTRGSPQSHLITNAVELRLPEAIYQILGSVL